MKVFGRSPMNRRATPQRDKRGEKVGPIDRSSDNEGVPTSGSTGGT